MTEPRTLIEATFDPKVKSYWIWPPVLFFTLLVVTIPIAILYGLVASLFTGRYLANLSCTLTERTLDIKKGIWNKTESTIPLEKITDLQLFQGPVMRFFGLHGFKVETAGQSASPSGGALVNLTGIVDTKDFRKSVLDQRDRLASGHASSASAPSAAAKASDSQTTRLLTEIRDSMRRIESSVSGSDETAE